MVCCASRNSTSVGVNFWYAPWGNSDSIDSELRSDWLCTNFNWYKADSKSPHAHTLLHIICHLETKLYLFYIKWWKLKDVTSQWCLLVKSLFSSISIFQYVFDYLFAFSLFSKMGEAGNKNYLRKKLYLKKKLNTLKKYINLILNVKLCWKIKSMIKMLNSSTSLKKEIDQKGKVKD